MQSRIFVNLLVEDSSSCAVGCTDSTLTPLRDSGTTAWTTVVCAMHTSLIRYRLSGPPGPLPPVLGSLGSRRPPLYNINLVYRVTLPIGHLHSPVDDSVCRGAVNARSARRSRHATFPTRTPRSPPRHRPVRRRARTRCPNCCVPMCAASAKPYTCLNRLLKCCERLCSVSGHLRISRRCGAG